MLNYQDRSKGAEADDNSTGAVMVSPCPFNSVLLIVL